MGVSCCSNPIYSDPVIRLNLFSTRFQLDGLRGLVFLRFFGG